MVSERMLDVRGGLAAPPMARVGLGLVGWVAAVLGKFVGYLFEHRTAVYGDADASVMFMTRRDLRHAERLRRLPR